ncbi:MAG: BatD family protein [Firmicutes bacterium]|nr:BatD family protein [Bacillota bacterium]MCM1400843.1 BatD family protein [Bacteroides sp.]MCM1476666.1 BatD family protein [Bacteroides sp.]
MTLLSMTAMCYAQQVSVIAPQRVYKGEKFHVTFRVTNGQGSEPRRPQINGCECIFGPTFTTRQSYQVNGNGQTSAQSSTEYTFIFRADKSGEVTIPSMAMQVNGKILKTRAQALTIVDGPGNSNVSNPYQTSRPNNGPVSIDDIESQTADRQVSSNDVFVRIILSKPTAYEQEAIDCTIKLYTKFNISQFLVTKQPNFDGFLIEEINTQASLNQEETYNGQRYRVAILKKCIIFPQKAGKLTINSGTYDINVVQFNSTNLGFIQQFSPRERKIQVTSNTASVDIKPLPSPRPDGFTGAVGQFSVSTRLIGSRFLTNDPGTLLYTVSGTGNIKYVKEPDVDFPSEFEVYTPKSNYDTHMAGQNVTGTMTTEFTFVPQSVGKFTIGADKFVYFDPTKNDYVTIETPSYPITVGQGAESASQKKDVEVKNKDIQHIVNSSSENPSFHYTMIITQWWYWILYIVLGAGLYTAIKLYGRSIARAADIRGMKVARANKVARQRLKAAQTFMQANQSDKFYEELLKAIWGYLSDKLSIPVSQLSRDNVASELTAYGASEELCTEVLSLIDECEMARYTPATTQEQLEKTYAKAADSINGLETIKKKRK